MMFGSAPRSDARQRVWYLQFANELPTPDPNGITLHVPVVALESGTYQFWATAGAVLFGAALAGLLYQVRALLPRRRPIR